MHHDGIRSLITVTNSGSCRKAALNPRCHFEVSRISTPTAMGSDIKSFAVEVQNTSMADAPGQSLELARSALHIRPEVSRDLASPPWQRAQHFTSSYEYCYIDISLVLGGWYRRNESCKAPHHPESPISISNNRSRIHQHLG